MWTASFSLTNCTLRSPGSFYLTTSTHNPFKFRCMFYLLRFGGFVFVKYVLQSFTLLSRRCWLGIFIRKGVSMFIHILSMTRLQCYFTIWDLMLSCNMCLENKISSVPSYVYERPLWDAHCCSAAVFITWHILRKINLHTTGTWISLVR